MSFGVVVGTDRAMEWLLPWWWEGYMRHNAFPVTFIDFGMSRKSLLWCQERGNLCALKKESAPVSDNPWKEAVFKKPAAMRLSPYETSIWIDIDCEICGSLQPLFHILQKDSSFGAVKSSPSVFNSGVVVFTKDSPVLSAWADLCLISQDLFATDDMALNFLLEKKDFSVTELPAIWNWFMHSGVNPSAQIVHYASILGKAFLRSLIVV